MVMGINNASSRLDDVLGNLGVPSCCSCGRLHVGHSPNVSYVRIATEYFFCARLGRSRQAASEQPFEWSDGALGLLDGAALDGQDDIPFRLPTDFTTRTQSITPSPQAQPTGVPVTL